MKTYFVIVILKEKFAVEAAKVIYRIFTSYVSAERHQCATTNNFLVAALSYSFLNADYSRQLCPLCKSRNISTISSLQELCNVQETLVIHIKIKLKYIYICKKELNITESLYFLNRIIISKLKSYHNLMYVVTCFHLKIRNENVFCFFSIKKMSFYFNFIFNLSSRNCVNIS